MTLQNACEKAMKIIAEYKDSVDSISLYNEACSYSYFQIEADGEACQGYFSEAVKSGKLAENLLLAQCGKLSIKELLSDKWEVKAIRRVYITDDELEGL